ncbi:terminase [Neptuniibacter halophilus]|uniref:terminase n=1 Tax=Neptuniibacter halophilus TaxID=651666 RepID=UPI0025736DB4|nr:terminase [Neptuniibacter halophilus]
MDRAEEVSLADKYIELYDSGQLQDKRDLIYALSFKWFRLNVLYKIKVKTSSSKDGKEISRVERFRPNKAQRKRYIEGWSRNIILKARQLGFTTFEMIDSLDDCLFNANFAAGCIAHKLDSAKDIFRNKIKFAYEHIPAVWMQIFEEIELDFPTPVNDKGEGYVFSNGSSIQVGTSYRGDTLQRLHVSEFGKICAKFPDKAEEIVTGAFEAVPLDGQLTLESTAEGNEGYFFDYCQEAQKLVEMGIPLTDLDFRFHFFPWWDEPDYTLPPDAVIITAKDKEYFEKLEIKIDRKLTAGQKAWYVKKASVLKDKMKREYPSTPKEAFEQAIEGAYYGSEMALVRQQSRIRSIPYDPRLPVHTFWDLGRNDSTSIWFMQHVHMEYRFIRYYENNGEAIQFYLKRLREFGYVFGTMYLPHDAEIVDLTREDNKSRKMIAQDAGFDVRVVPRVQSKGEAIQAVRDILNLCWFDEENAAQGIKCLDHYRKEWDDKLGAFKDSPRHDWASHGNDAFEQFARGYVEHTMPESFEPEVWG